MTNRDTKYIDYRPWGHYKIIADYPGYKVKILSVNPGQKLSLQYHDHRKEVWTVLAGTAKIKLDGIEKTLLEQQTLNIEIGQVHRLENPSDTDDLKVLEIAFGKIIREDDIHRLNDDYGRAIEEE